MLFTDFFGITAPMSIFIDDSVLMSLSRFHSLKALVQTRNEWYSALSVLEKTRTPKIEKMVQESLNITPIEFKKKFILKDPKVMELIDKLIPEYGEISPKIDGVVLSDNAYAILKYFWSNKDKFKSLALGEEVYEFLDIPVEDLANGIYLPRLYNNYKERVHKDPSLVTVNLLLKKIEAIKELNNPVVDEGSQDMEINPFMVGVDFGGNSKIELNILYTQVSLATQVFNLNSEMGLSLTERDYYEAGLELNKVKFVGFNPYTPDLFEIFIKKNQTSIQPMIFNDKFQKILYLIEKDLKSLRSRYE